MDPGTEPYHPQSTIAGIGVLIPAILLNLLVVPVAFAVVGG